jgi:UDP-3-O-acyl N-acetylglucosamine deacetylase
MIPRTQNSLRRAAELSGFGLFSGADVSVRFLPAEEETGIVFRRVDLPGCPEVPARLEHLTTTARRTSLIRGDARVELTEHVLAALAGLRIDNCVIELDAPELPGVDGSCRPFVDVLLDAGIEPQSAPRAARRIDRLYEHVSPDRSAGVKAQPANLDELALTYHLDYGERSPIKPQSLTVVITPESFLNEVAFARTFVLESEVAALRAAGYGTRVTERDLLVFGPEGVIGNSLRAKDECARHKILDCLGDFALLGCDLIGHVTAWRSGHHMNQELARRIEESDSVTSEAA